MRRSVFSFVFLAAVLMSLLSGGLAFARPVVSMPGDKVRISSWIDSRFSKGAALPFSFALDGVPSSEFMGRWKRGRQVLPSADPSAVSFRYTWTGSKEGLSVICDVTGYPESNLVEWVVRFRNISGNNFILTIFASLSRRSFN